MRIDRNSGAADKFCVTTNLFKSTPCSHFINDGKRYLHFPKENKCCVCCTDQKGCGVLKIDWLLDAEKVREFTLDGYQMVEWKKQGIAENKIITYKVNDLIYQIKMGTTDNTIYDRDSFEVIFDDEIFDLPQVCTQAKQCGGLSLCNSIN